MKNKFVDVFTSNGFFLNKKISVHLALQKGRNHCNKLGHFDLDLSGCSNLARKAALLALIALVWTCGALLKKKNKIFSKST